MDSEIDKFLKDYRDKNINSSYDKNKNKFSTEEIFKSLDRLHNKLIEYNKFKDNIVKLEYYKSKKEPGSVSPNQNKMRRYVKGLKAIVDLYNLKSGSDTSNIGKGLKILTNKQMLNCLPLLLAQIQAGIKDYRDKNINSSYDKNKNKFSTEEITKSLDRLHNKLREYNKFKDNIVKFEYYKSKKEPGSVSPNQIKLRRYVKGLKAIVDLYNLKSGSDMSNIGKGLKILTNKQMLNCLPILLA